MYVYGCKFGTGIQIPPPPAFRPKIVYFYVIEVADSESDLGLHGRALVSEIFVFYHLLEYARDRPGLCRANQDQIRNQRPRLRRNRLFLGRKAGGGVVNQLRKFFVVNALVMLLVNIYSYSLSAKTIGTLPNKFTCKGRYSSISYSL